jgi:glycerol-3-phosphate dehydrogenase
MVKAKMDREHQIIALRNSPEISVLIIGAGINGIGAFRDLALQGVDVLLIDQGDFCSGASAASSHMIHGGLRYLENGEFRLVREAVRERNNLLQNAPHYVRPLPTTVPIFKWFSGLFNAPLKFLRMLDQPAERGGIVIKIGLLLYDAYTGSHRAVPKHRFRLRRSALGRYPQLNPDIVSTATYYDGAISAPERMCIELILDAESASLDAHALNYMKMIAGSGDTVTLQDEKTGENFTIKPITIINAAGPWIDQANRTMEHSSRLIGGTKGSHIVLRHPDLRDAIGEQEFFFENEDGRIVLMYPLKNRVLVGSSDIRIEDPDQARCTEEEVDYFLTMVKQIFPEIEINRSHIVYRFSGVRPLPFGGEKQTGQISRDHQIKVVEPRDEFQVPVYCLVGGKWTTFRAFAEQITDIVLNRLGRRRKINTEILPIGGGADYPRSEAERQSWLHSLNLKTGLPMARLEVLFERYGTRAVGFVDYFVRNGDKSLKHHWTFSRQEVELLVQQEKILHLEDLVLRRTSLAKLGELTTALLDELASILTIPLDWSERERKEELERTVSVLYDRHGVRL